MARLSDLIRDSKLETHFEPHSSVETVHTYNTPDPTSRRRLVRRSEHWKRQNKIGGGSYGSVWLEKCTKGYRDVQVRAIKQLEKHEQFAHIDYTRELEAIAKFSHAKYERCFVKSFGWYESPEHLFIAMEYLDLGDLHTYLYRNPALLEHDAREVTYQILDGLNLMHENEFCHRDLKPSNILLKSCPPDEWWVKIADFGISKRTEEGLGLSTTVKGTLGYIAPEVYGFTERGSPYAVDIWAVGEIAFQMLTKKSSFKHIGILSRYVSKPEIFPSQLLLDVPVTQLGVDFILSLMNPNPGERVTAAEALQNEWMEQSLPNDGQDSSAAEPAHEANSVPTNEPVIEGMGTWNTAHEVTWDTSTIKPATKISEVPVPDTSTIRRKSLPKTTTPAGLERSTTPLVQNFNDDLGRLQLQSTPDPASSRSVESSHSDTVSKSFTSTEVNESITPTLSPTSSEITKAQPYTIERSHSEATGHSSTSIEEVTFDDIITPSQSPSGSETTKSTPPPKRSLWSRLKRNMRRGKDEEAIIENGVFGVPLSASIRHANVAISLTNDDGESFIYGYVPIVVAKCGVFLKEKGTSVKGLFETEVSTTRVQELQFKFDNPVTKYGKGLNWTGYTVHEAAWVLLTYLKRLPESVIILEFYERFRDPIRSYQMFQSQGIPETYTTTIVTYQNLIAELPPINKHLLLYLLDVLAVFASNSDENGLNPLKISTIFQMAILYHPQHLFIAAENDLCRDVLTFLIENQDHFLFGIENQSQVQSQEEPEVQNNRSRAASI
ncbi:kinase-like domain-containing protein [Talaromyces proteolyticus]|uniref:Kinase-like domain-containing protein n=1 Tax=Talaromyces proteolyticus TaxID=1131652 RepID=A0AAD4KPC2_9EURO|nr:kinase-like domain-containing protein [Talaromyces proteolyticus]KAH8693006.1 kinase-like domain-containing protein [Talaromyces proteolyticus]